jgi:hypothetical protein
MYPSATPRAISVSQGGAVNESMQKLEHTTATPLVSSVPPFQAPITSMGAIQVMNESTNAQKPYTSVSCTPTAIFQHLLPTLSQQEAMPTYFAKNPQPYSADRFNGSQQVYLPGFSANGIVYTMTIYSQLYLAFTRYYTSSCQFGRYDQRARPVAGRVVEVMNPMLYVNTRVINDITNARTQWLVLGRQTSRVPRFRCIDWTPRYAARLDSCWFGFTLRGS